MHKKKSTILMIMVVLLSVLLLVSFIAVAYFFSEYQKAKKLIGSQSKISKSDVTILLDRVNKLYELPKGETPSIMTVTDTKKLRSQPFFTKAQNGDKVLVFQKSKKIILFRPSTDKIIEVSFLTVLEPTRVPTPVN